MAEGSGDGDVQEMRKLQGVHFGRLAIYSLALSILRTPRLLASESQASESQFIWTSFAQNSYRYVSWQMQHCESLSHTLNR